MESLIVAMVVFALVGAMTPGPVNFLATNIAINQGRMAAAWHVVGASLAYALVVWVSGVGLNSLATLIPKLDLAMQIFASVFLLWIAYQLIGFSDKGNSTPLMLHRWWSGALLQLVNPKAWMVATAGVGLFVLNQPLPQTALLFFTLVSLCACLIGVGCWALIGGFLSAALASDTKRRTFNQIMAALLTMSVVALWLD